MEDAAATPAPAEEPGKFLDEAEKAIRKRKREDERSGDISFFSLSAMVKC